MLLSLSFSFRTWSFPISCGNLPVCNPICSYLICCMFGEAASSASTILKQLLESHNLSRKGSEVPESFENEWCDMLESAGMVLVQSMKQLKRWRFVVLVFFVHILIECEPPWFWLICVYLSVIYRTPEILKELKLLFGSLTLIPVHVFLTGYTCIILIFCVCAIIIWITRRVWSEYDLFLGSPYCGLA